MKTLQEKIQEILDKCSKGKYIFRGENKKYEKVSSGLYRQYCQRDDSKPNDSNPVIDNEHFFVSSIEQNIIEGAKKHFRLGALNIEVLTELQHYGGKTTLLDFSKDLHIALFFACDGNVKKNGRVILFKRSELTESAEIDYEQIDKTKYTLISPTGKSPRVIFQSSIFVHVPRGYLEKSRYETIEIEKELKKPILDYLRQYFDIKTETVYNDIQGFIRNQHNHPAAEIEFYRGLENSKLGKYNKAIENYTKSIKLNPQHAMTYNNRGLAKHALENYKEAIEDYNKAVELDSQDAIFYNSRGVANSALGECNSALGEYNAAIADFSKAIELNPQYANAYNNRGNINSALGKHQEAIADFSKAIELNSKDAIAYYNRGLANSKLKKYQEAIADFSKAIELNPQYANAYNNRGLANHKLENYKEAIADYSKAIEFNPQDDEYYYNRGLANHKLENYKEAIADYSKAIELNPQDAWYYYNRGTANHKLENYNEAIADFDKAIELNPQNAGFYCIRSLTHSTCKNYKAAIADYSEAKPLFAKAGNMEMVKECEEEIVRLKKLLKPKS